MIVSQDAIPLDKVRRFFAYSVGTVAHSFLSFALRLATSEYDAIH